MAEPSAADAEQFFRLMALHKYFLNADFLRDVFFRRIKQQAPPDELNFAIALDNAIAMSLWYASLYVVIEGWREARLSDREVDQLLEEDRVETLRRFRNQVFHYQPAYDNPKLLEFLGVSDDDAHEVTQWVRQLHKALGTAIERSIRETQRGI